MADQEIPLRTTAARFTQAIRDFANSRGGRKAKFMLAGLVALLCGANALNVANSYVGRNFMTSIADRDKAEFVRQALFYVGVFAASTVVAVVARFIEERLALLWRESLTRRIIERYMADGTYYHVDVRGTLANPDQRIAEDVRAFTVTTLSFVLMAFNSSLTVVAFSGVLWTISPVLFAVAVLYAACGSLITVLLGRPLVRLNYNQLDCEASFRAELIHVRENAEAIFLSRQEGPQTFRLLHRLDALIVNFRQITTISRNVGFFTTGYNWMIQIIPVLIIAPAFISGQVEFGVITQSAMAFSALVAAFSLIITQFQSISTFAAVIARLSSLAQAVERSQTDRESGIEFARSEGSLVYDGLTLRSSTDAAPLVNDLSISIPSGTRVLIKGPNEVARVALFRASAGASIDGTGRIARPDADKIHFLAQRPYFQPGALREVLAPSEPGRETLDAQIIQVLRALSLDSVVLQAGGLESERDWKAQLSLRDQNLLAIARTIIAAPHFVFLDRVGASLGADHLQKVLQILSKHSITYINSEDADETHDIYDAVMECREDGSWSWTSIRDG